MVEGFDGDGGWVVRSDEPEASGGYYGPFSNKGPRGGDRYDLFFYDPDQPVSGEVLLQAPFTTVVTFPADQPISNARLQPVPGWVGVVKKVAPATPITDDEGEAITEQVQTVTWTAAAGASLRRRLSPSPGTASATRP